MVPALGAGSLTRGGTDQKCKDGRKRSPGKHMAGSAWLERVSTLEEVLAGVAKVECAVSMAACLAVKSWVVGAASIRRTQQEMHE